MTANSWQPLSGAHVYPHYVNGSFIVNMYHTHYCVDTSSTPFSLEHILPEVMPMASKWLALGEALSLDEDRLDEIFTNNETEEACLHVMLEHYMMRSDLKHSWEEIETAMNKVKEAQDMDASELLYMFVHNTITTVLVCHMYTLFCT